MVVSRNKKFKSRPRVPARGLAVRHDNAYNTMNGIGGALDKSKYEVAASVDAWDVAVADDKWKSSKLLRRVIQLPAQHAIAKAGWNTDNLGNPESREYHDWFRWVLNEAIQWKRAYGASAILITTEDSAQDVDQPISNLREIANLVVLSPDEYSVGEVDSDPFSVNFRAPKNYRLRLTGSNQKIVDASRMITFGEQGWPGEAQLSEDAIAKYLGSITSASVLLTDFAQAIYKVKGLVELAATADPEILRNRVTAIESTRSILHAMILDADNEDFERKTTNVSGMSELIARIAENMAAHCELPLSMLLGQVPAGLNASGESDQKYWQEACALVQSEADDAVRYFDELVQELTGETIFPEHAPNDWRLWLPISQPTRQEIAATQQIESAVDVAYINAGVLSPDEVRKMRFADLPDDPISTERTVEDPNATAEPEPDPTGESPDNQPLPPEIV